MVLAGITVTDTVLVRDAIDLPQSASEPFLFNHAMRSWLFGVLLSESAERAPDAELLAVATILHDLGLTDRYTAEHRFEVDGANAARSFLKGRGISTQQMQVVWDAIARHTTRSIALHKEPEVAMTHSGITIAYALWTNPTVAAYDWAKPVLKYFLIFLALDFSFITFRLYRIIYETLADIAHHSTSQ
jgi:hypothetical protein